MQREKKNPLLSEWGKSAWQQSTKEKRQHRSSAQKMRKSGCRLPALSATVGISHMWLLMTCGVVSMN